MSIVDMNNDALAIDGFDPVSYWKGEPLQGAPEFRFELDDVTYWFANRENLEKFQETPAKYIPQYGGYCAWGMTKGERETPDPTNYKIHNDRLFLFYRKNLDDARRNWENDIPAYVKQADEFYGKKMMSEQKIVEMQNLSDSEN